MFYVNILDSLRRGDHFVAVSQLSRIIDASAPSLMRGRIELILTKLKRAAWAYPRSVFATLGLFWLIIEPIIGLTGESIDLTYWGLFGWSALFGLVWLSVDGLWFSGFLKHNIEIKSSGFDTKIITKFGDIFQQDGWKAIAVNDFFDSIVDDCYVSSRSLHGILLQRYWAGNTDDWDRQIDDRLSDKSYSPVTRDGGKQKRYEIGTTAEVRKNSEKFLCVALSFTDVSNLETKATSLDLIKAVRELLRKARSVCADEPLNIPLMGSGLSRVGIKGNILIHLILTAILEETKIKKVTSEIRIILPKDKASEICLNTLQKDWSAK